MNKSIQVSLMLIFVCAAGNAWSQSVTTADTKQTVTSLTLPDLSGQQRDLSEWRNKVLVVNFWASWCPPCLKEIPEFISLQKTMGGQGLQSIGVAIEAADSAQAFLTTLDMNYPNLIAGDDGIVHTIAFGNRTGALPFTVIIDRQGQIRHRQAGPMSQAQVLQIVEPLL